MNEIIVIDDCISNENQKLIKDICVGPTFPWYSFNSSNYNPNSSVETFSKQQLEIYNNRSQYFDSPQFSHLVFDEGVANSNHLPVLIPLLSSIPVQIEQLLKIKFNMKYPKNNNNFGVPHFDLNLNSFLTALYYVNDSDGDTVIFNQRNNEDFETLTIKQTISPKQGRIIIFDGTLYHSAGNPLLQERIVININFIAKSACL